MISNCLRSSSVAAEEHTTTAATTSTLSTNEGFVRLIRLRFITLPILTDSFSLSRSDRVVTL